MPGLLCAISPWGMRSSFPLVRAMGKRISALAEDERVQLIGVSLRVSKGCGSPVSTSNAAHFEPDRAPTGEAASFGARRARKVN